MLRFFGVWLLGLSLAVAQEPEASAPDFSEGFRLLRELGLPEVTGATWGRFEAEGGRRGGGVWAPVEGAASSLEVELEGNGWRLPGEGEAGGLVLGGAIEPTKVRFQRKKSIIGRLLGGSGGGNAEEGTAGSWEEGDLAADLVTLREAIEGSADDDEDGMAMHNHMERSNSWGTLLVFAAQAHAVGEADEANALAEAIFEKAGRASSVIDSVVASLAEREFTAVTTAFFSERDWKAYRDGLQGLLEKYPRGWSKAGAVRILLPKVEARASGGPVPAPSIEGEAIAPEALAQIARFDDGAPAPSTEGLAALVEQMGFDFSELTPEMREMVMQQLVQSGQLGRMARGSGAGSLWPLTGHPELQEGAGPLEVLRAMRLDGVLALAALATDETLVPVARGGRNYYGSHHVRSGGIASEVALAEQQYQSMHRPATRGELARAALAEALPSRGGELGAYLPDELQEYAVEWWRTNRNAAPLELARQYLVEGGPGQQLEAAQWLAGQDSEEAAQVFEAGVFEAPSLLGMVSAVEAYLRVRKEKAKPFFDKFAAEVKEEVGSGGGEPNPFGGGYTYAIQEAGGVDGYLKKLEVHVAKVTPEEMLEDIRKGELSAEQGVEILGELFREKAEEFPAFLVNAAASLEEVEARFAFLSKLFELAYRSEAPGEGEADEQRAKLLAATRESWEDLLNDKRDLPESWYEHMQTVQQFAAMAMEPLFGTDFEGVWTLSEAMGDECAVLLEQRARARLEGTDLPQLPEAARVEEARRKEMREQAANAGALEMAALMEGWSWDERLAWGELIESWEGDLPAGWVEAEFLVTEGPEKMPNGLEGWKVGTKVDLGLLEATVETLRKDVGESGGLAMVVSARRGMPGLALQLDPESSEYYGEYVVGEMDEYGLQRGVVLMIESEEHDETAVWPEVGVEILPGEAADGHESFRAAMKEILEGGDWGEETTLWILTQNEESLKQLREEMEGEEEE